MKSSRKPNYFLPITCTVSAGFSAKCTHTHTKLLYLDEETSRNFSIISNHTYTHHSYNLFAQPHTHNAQIYLLFMAIYFSLTDLMT